jgi:1-phosphatidylinositol-3-phosphate 5-kinase
VRLYTWDKRLETLVKSAGILGGAGKTPTVISPDAYMRRFRDAIAVCSDPLLNLFFFLSLL